MINLDVSNLIKELDSSDLFLRNRSKCIPAPLNEYDIELMQDAAKTCDRAARTLEKCYLVPYNVGDTLYFINHLGNIDTDTIKYITITKTGAKPILNHHNIRFWNYHELGRDVFFTEAEALEAKKRLEARQ